ncbi:MAG: hypothetical protein JNG88_07655 [Phycisphaerales bacterium]|nr:hypothetical protein [Phycisphaerales bacterium]
MTPLIPLEFDGPKLVGSSSDRRRLMIVEPDSLLRWSIMAYLKPWFDVILTDSALPARESMRRHIVDALIVSGEIQSDAIDALCNSADARGVRPPAIVTITGVEPSAEAAVGHARDREHLWSDHAVGCDRPIHFVEKPFELKRLADLLGVNSPNAA